MAIFRTLSKPFTKVKSPTSTETATTPIQLHTIHLTPSQQSYVRQNPTYSFQLTALEALATQITLHRQTLHSREVGKLPDVASKTLSRGEGEAFEGPREECRQLEEKLRQWDDELAGLAEALLARPRFGVGEEVVWRESENGEGGSWWWRVPDG